jgi:hypothetical protein
VLTREESVVIAKRETSQVVIPTKIGELVDVARQSFDCGSSGKNMIGRTIVTVRLALWTMLFAFVVWPGIEAAAQDLGPVVAKHSASASTPEQSNVIVIGFMGGFVHRDDPQHPEVRLIRELRQEHPTGTYFGLLENSCINEAYQTILRELNLRDGDPLSEDKARRARILLFGHSWGASAVVRLARKLDRAGIPVALTVQVDSVANPFSNDGIIPSNVFEAANFYQVHGLIHGRSTITAADVERTRIIGNFRRDYQTEPAACRNFPCHSRLFTKGHIEIECDPNLWSEVRVLLERDMPSDARTAGQLQAFGSHEPSPAAEFGVVDRMDYLQSKPIGRNGDNGHCCD